MVAGEDDSFDSKGEEDLIHRLTSTTLKKALICLMAILVISFVVIEGLVMGYAHLDERVKTDFVVVLGQVSLAMCPRRV